MVFNEMKAIDVSSTRAKNYIDGIEIAINDMTTRESFSFFASLNSS
jgi:hypothetical protein